MDKAKFQPFLRFYALRVNPEGLLVDPEEGFNPS